MRRDAILRSLMFTVLLAGFAAAPAFAQAVAKEKDQAELEAKLEAARARLEAAAREVAELSGELTGPVMHDFVMAYGAHDRRAMLGINIGGGDEDAKDGVHVQSVTPGGPASDAGLKAGDVIVGIDGKNLRGTDRRPSAALVQHMRTLKPGDKVKVEYQRDGKTQTSEITTEALGPGHMMAMPAIRPLLGAHPVPPIGGVPFTRAFHGFGRAEFLDMELVTLTPKLGRYFGTDKGVLVVRPPRSGDLKLEDGDVIVDIDGRKPENGGHALRILRSYQPGEKVTLNVLRDRKPVKLAVAVPARAANEPDEGAFFFDEPVPFTKVVPATEEDAT
ncbi:MAG TPA: PDZ domain-containing protein [Steroidobacteraceae bacterium]